MDLVKLVMHTIAVSRFRQYLQLKKFNVINSYLVGTTAPFDYLLNTVSKSPVGFAFSISSCNAVTFTRLVTHSISCVEAC